MNARFHGEARIEFLESVAYYEAVQVGLGERFRQSIEAAVELAASLPFAGAPHRHGTRRVFPKKFPFSVVYLVKDNEIVIFAVAHFKRRPGYWKNRRHDR
ncbi:MAG: type II toxin-antitoxin system RelE/ParE family toxin [Burkholderiaceae bacterium]|nr:type II toxin-antitoxin system RelE/ParE family toxin [Burkholderiaceae bacterium]MDZ4145794.1 type II toxin-antitoxin system RelE/ParE family toxin [Burkholderiales bacterium]